MSKARDLASLLSASGDVKASALDNVASSGTADFVASGTLPNGAPVVLKSDGTVEAVGGSSVAISESIPAGSANVFNTNFTTSMAIRFDPNDTGKFVVAYRDVGGSDYGKAVVGTVSGGSISFGAAVVFSSSSQTGYVSMSFDPNITGKFVIAYADGGNSSYGKVIVGTISGNSVSFGAAVVFNSGHTLNNAISFDPSSAGKCVITYRDLGNSSRGAAIVGTVAGDSISLGSVVVFNSGATYYPTSAFDPSTAGRFIISYKDPSNSNYGRAVVGTISGNSITFGSTVSYSSGAIGYTAVVWDPNTVGKCVIAYIDSSNSNNGTAVVGSISGTSASFGSAVVFSSANASSLAVAMDPNTVGGLVVTYGSTGNPAYGSATIGTISGSSISFGSPFTLSSGDVGVDTAIAFDSSSSGQFVVLYTEPNTAAQGVAVVGQLAATITTSTNLTADNFIGTSSAAYANAATASIVLAGGVSSNQTGLVTNSTYYVQADGTLDTTAGDPSVVLGKALSATSLQLAGPAGPDTTAKAGTADFVASGTLPNGAPVILNADGTVSVVSQASTPENIPAGTEAQFNSTSVHDIAIAFNPSDANKFVLAYKDGSTFGYGTAVVGTVSGTSIVFGAKAVFNSGMTMHLSIAFDPNTAGKFVVAYRDHGNSSYTTAVVGTMSGTSISFGAEVIFSSSTSYYRTSIAFDPNTAGKFVVAFSDGANAFAGTTIVGIVSGTSITFGAKVAFNAGTTDYFSLLFDPNTAGQFVVAYRGGAATTKGTAIVGTVSGTSVSFDSAAEFNSYQAYDVSAAFNPSTSGQLMIAYKDGGNSNYGTVVIGTLAGTSLSFGSEIVFHSGSVAHVNAAFDPRANNKLAIAFRSSDAPDYGSVVVGTVLGSSVSFGSEITINEGYTNYSRVVFDPNTPGSFVVAYADGIGNDTGKAIVGHMPSSSTNLTATNFIGTSTAAYADAATATIALPSGLATNQSGLTAGSVYYVQADGTLGTTADTPSVEAGKALSATSLLLKSY